MSVVCSDHKHNPNLPINDIAFDQSESIRLDEVDFKNNQELFETLVDKIEEAEYNRWLYVNKQNLADSQWSVLSKLCNTNHLKGLQIYAIDYFMGVVPGFLHMNSNKYNESKLFIAESQVRWTLLQAIGRYYPQMTINSVFDFGAGLSPELLYLTKNSFSIDKIVAADFDASQLEHLRNAFPENYKEKLETFAGAFIRYESCYKFDLFLSSFTFPYRSPSQFPAVWEKAVSMVSRGGVMAFHLFGKPESPKAEMTYHSLKKIKKLLVEICSEFEILVEYPDGSCLFVFWMDGEECHTRSEVFFDPKNFLATDVYGGESPEWGTLYHVVAKLK